MLTSLNSIDDPARLAGTIAAHMPLKLADKRSVLEVSDVNERLEYLMAMMESEIDLLQVEKRVQPREKADGEIPARYYLNEQMADSERTWRDGRRAGRKQTLKRKIDAAKMPKGGERKRKRNCRS